MLESVKMRQAKHSKRGRVHNEIFYGDPKGEIASLRRQRRQIRVFIENIFYMIDVHYKRYHNHHHTLISSHTKLSQ